MTETKLPPHSLDAEQAILGGLLLDGAVWPDVADQVSASDFYREDHRLLFEAIAQLADANDPCDQITVVESLRGSGRLDKAGGSQYIGSLVADTPSTANIRAYAGIVREKAQQRALIQAGSAMAQAGFAEDGRPVAEKLDEAESSVSAIRDTRAGTGPVDARQIVNETIESIEFAHESGDEVTGLPTGFPDLDEKLGGLQKTDLIYVAGRPSMGKTMMALQICENGALNGKRALVFSLEMSRMRLMQRAMSRWSQIPLKKIRRSRLMQDADWSDLTDISARLAKSGLIIDDTSGLSILDVRSRARREHRRAPLDVIVVDFIQLMATDASADNRNDAIRRISNGLKALAKELDLPVLAISQLNRELEKREDKRPRMSDLRECGDLEQDADLILFVYRDEAYRPNGPHQGIAEFIIGKQRDGELGATEAVFKKEHVRFLPYAGPSHEEREVTAPRGKSVGMEY